MSELVFDEDAARRIEALYLIEDARRRRRLVRQALAAEPGERILDVGCGPGFYCVELLEEVGPSGSVVGVDSSPAMLALAARRCAGHDNVEFHESDAVSLPVEDASCDGACASRSSSTSPTPAAGLAEMYRALKPGGRVVVWDIDWATLSIHSDDDDRMRRVSRRSGTSTRAPVAALDPGRPACADVGSSTSGPRPTVRHRRVRPGDATAPPSFRSSRAFVDGRDGLTERETHQWLAEQRALGERGEFYFASTQFCFTGRKPG